MASTSKIYYRHGLEIGWQLAATRRKPDQTCPVCKKSFHRRGKRQFNGKLPSCCSVKCRAILRTQSSGLYKKRPRKCLVLINCKLCSKEVSCYPSNKRIYCSKQCQDKDLSIHDSKRGPNHWKWNNGATKENQKARNSREYRLWVKAVYTRDNYTCQKCGIRGVELNAHHIKIWSEYPELRFDVNNGLTVCLPCHSKIHNRPMLKNGRH